MTVTIREGEEVCVEAEGGNLKRKEGRKRI